MNDYGEIKIVSGEKIKGLSLDGLILGIEKDEWDSKLKQEMREQINCGRKTK